MNPLPYYREAGGGPGVVCIHSNASNSAQWRGLMERLAPRVHVFAADSYGAGKSPAWTAQRTIMLGDEVVSLEGLGHMGPVTHPDTVNGAIARFFERVW